MALLFVPPYRTWSRGFAVTPEEARAKLRANAPTCFLCKLIDEDLDKNQKLTDAHPPKSIDGSYQFPAASKAIHLRLEGITKKA